MKVPQASIKVILLVSTCCLVFQVTQVSSVGRRGEGRRYCGSYLVDMLSFVCEGSYNTMLKRYDPDTDDLPAKWITMENLPFLSKNAAYSMLVKRSSPFLRKSRGIVEECCKKPCSFNVLNSYCLPKTTRRPDSYLSTTQRYERSAQQADY